MRQLRKRREQKNQKPENNNQSAQACKCYFEGKGRCNLTKAGEFICHKKICTLFVPKEVGINAPV